MNENKLTLNGEIEVNFRVRKVKTKRRGLRRSTLVEIECHGECFTVSEGGDVTLIFPLVVSGEG